MVIKGGPPPNLGLYYKLFATRLFTRRSKVAICLWHNEKEVKALLCTKRLLLVGRICADLGPDCSLFVKSQSL